MSPAKKRPGAAAAVKKRAASKRADASAVLASSPLPAAPRKPPSTPDDEPVPTKAAPNGSPGSSTKKVTIALPDEMFEGLRAKSFAFKTTQRAIHLAMFELLNEGLLDAEIKARVANRRLEGKRGPKGGLRN